MKLAAVRTAVRSALALLLAAAFGAAASAQGLPSYPAIERRLEIEIQKMIAAGHLAPGLATFEQHYRYDAGQGQLGWELDDYWHNPAELVYTLALAIPHLPPQTRAQAVAYLRQEFALFPPTEYVHMGPSGARREYSDVPPEYASIVALRYGQLESPATESSWPGWLFDPFNFYACAKYAELFPAEARAILDAVRFKVAPLPSDDVFLQARPHVVNVYIAGYYGYLRLQGLAGEPPSGLVQSWLDAALAKRLALLQAGSAQLNGSEAGGFLWLTPELGDYLNRNARALVQQAVDHYAWAAPYWFLSSAQEVTRYWPGRGFMEGYSAHIYDKSSQFLARAYALKTPRSQLQDYVDAPVVPRGDLYYIQNLCATIGTSLFPPPPALPAHSDRIGVYRNGVWELDSDGNGTPGPPDAIFGLGWPGAIPVTGDWDGDGRDNTGVYSQGFWYLDYNGDGVYSLAAGDKLTPWGWPGAEPVVGDWDGDGRDQIGVYSGGVWILDYNGDYLWNAAQDKNVGWGWPGATVVTGDWDGDGRDQIGVYSGGVWILDYNGDYLWDGGVADKIAPWGWAGTTPIVGDWNGDGKTQIGVHFQGSVYADYDGNYVWDAGLGDRVWSFGVNGSTPVVGDWNGDGTEEPGAVLNGQWRLDDNGDGVADVRFYSLSPGELPVPGRW